MRCRVLTQLLFAFGLVAQTPPDVPRQFRLEADGVELSFSTDASKVQVSGNRTTFALRDGLEIRLDHSPDSGGFRISAVIRNASARHVVLGRVTLAERSDAALRGAHFLAMS